jgi:hypothetical protein
MVERILSELNLCHVTTRLATAQYGTSSLSAFDYTTFNIVSSSSSAFLSTFIGMFFYLFLFLLSIFLYFLS